MARWPSAFGQRFFVFFLKIVLGSVVVLAAGCAANEPAKIERHDVARFSFPNTYEGAEDSVSMRTGLDPFSGVFAHTYVIDPKPAYDEASMAATKASFSGLRPKIVTPRRPLQCVPYARMVSGINLRGDAHTWWDQAEGRFQRGSEPAPGAVMVVRGSHKTPLGHVAVVTKILNEREILVDHANWLNNERIHLATPVIDVSPNNDWSAIRVWYTPGSRYGANVYPLAGFIYADTPSLFITVTNANVRAQPTTKAKRIATLPRRSRVEVLGKVPGAPWFRIAHEGMALGYIHAKLIKPTS